MRWPAGPNRGRSPIALDIAFRCRVVGGDASTLDGEFQEVRWHRLDDLPELAAYDLEILRQAAKYDDQAAYLV
jgi:hypothetical protein